MKRAGTTYEGRAIALVQPGYGLTLYRISFGNGSYDSEPSDLSCTWDGERPGRLYAYYDRLDEAHGFGDHSTAVYCGLHCWGQDKGYTDL